MLSLLLEHQKLNNFCFIDLLHISPIVVNYFNSLLLKKSSLFLVGYVNALKLRFSILVLFSNSVHHFSNTFKCGKNPFCIFFHDLKTELKNLVWNSLNYLRKKPNNLNLKWFHFIIKEYQWLYTFSSLLFNTCFIFFICYFLIGCFLDVVSLN